MSPVISVVIPCYNAERTIKATIESALAQDVDREIIVINDGSTDGSGDLIATFGTEIQVISGPNQGVSAARNEGTKLARGDFLQYVDSDDLLVPGTLKRRVDALLNNSASVAYCDWQKLVETADGSFQPGQITFMLGDLLAEDSEAACASSRFWAPPVALLYRREIVEKIGLWRPNLPIVQDARFLFDAAAHGASFCHVPSVGALYRVTVGSLSRGNRARFIHDCCINTAEIEHTWRLQDTLTPLRNETLKSMWRHVAIAALVEDLPDFDAARCGYNQLVGRDPILEFGWLLRKVLGPRLTGSLVRWNLNRASTKTGNGHNV